MTPDYSELINISGISYPLIGVYDVSDTVPFEPVKSDGHCIFEHFSAWCSGQGTIINAETASSLACPGAGYWMNGIETVPREMVAEMLAGKEGLKASPELMCQWLEKAPPRTARNGSIVISPLKTDQYDNLKTVTFFVTPDQFSMLLTGADYLNPNPDQSAVIAPTGSGCGQLLTMFSDLDAPAAIIGATDMAMRKYLPDNILAFTVTRPMFEQLCSLDKESFLYKTFWNDLKEARASTQGG